MACPYCNQSKGTGGFPVSQPPGYTVTPDPGLRFEQGVTGIPHERFGKLGSDGKPGDSMSPGFCLLRSLPVAFEGPRGHLVRFSFRLHRATISEAKILDRSGRGVNPSACRDPVNR